MNKIETADVRIEVCRNIDNDAQVAQGTHSLNKNLAAPAVSTATVVVRKEYMEGSCGRNVGLRPLRSYYAYLRPPQSSHTLLIERLSTFYALCLSSHCV
jgi:hypothetical protein